jgi:NAD(P)-dependent dehydrogenase (short-subunit alcohol dehydrogenase family)
MLAGLGGLWREQGSAPPFKPHLGRRTQLGGVRVLSIHPGDMDTPLHAAAVPDADRSTLKRPEVAARELADTVSAALSRRTRGSEQIVQEAIG